MFRKISILITILLLSFSNYGYAAKKVKVVASTTDIASIAKEIGKDKISISSLASGKSDPHYVEVLPSYMRKVSKADLYLKVGMSLDFWADLIIEGSRNSKLYIADCSDGITPLEVPKQQVDASMGDVHPEGNPHYQLDPENGHIIAGNIYKALVAVDPENDGFYKANLDAFNKKLDEKIKEWKQKAAPLRGMEVITYHKSWSYFSRAFGIKIIDTVEPKPGIEPTPSHTKELINLIKTRNIPLIIKEPYYSNRAPNTIARATGIKVLQLPPSVGGAESVNDYFALFDYLINSLLEVKEEA